MWEVHYSQESAAYLEDNGQLIADLFFAMESLADSNGIPMTGDFQAVQELIYWSFKSHLVVYRRMMSSKIVIILFIKPD